MGPNERQQHDSGNLARYFQAQYADFSDDLPLYQTMADQVGGPVLELGCGTGRILLRLAAAGFEVIGIDRDWAMIKRLSSQIPNAAAQRVKIIQARVESLPLEGGFPLVISPCSTLAYLPDPTFRRVLDDLFKLITKGGRLVMDLPSPNQALFDLIDDPIIESFHEPEVGSDVQVLANQRQIEDGIHEIDWHYEEMLANGVTTRQSFTTRYHLRTLPQVKTMLVQAGFKLTGAYGDYQLTPYRQESPGLIIEAETDR